jgi:nitroimidazol reductase NimA-like FMN-containing flavoprotein (pyridoxamine 5'-phosphate oxidase superfamily)
MLWKIAHVPIAPRATLARMASDPTSYEPTPRTTPTRKRDRAAYERAAIHAVLDEAVHCHLGYVVDGAPVVVPTIHARRGEVLYVHASTGARIARLAAGGDGVPVTVAVTLVDALVLARSQFHHSMNYRSVTVHALARLVTDVDERSAALAAVVEHVAPGRSAQSRPGDRQELAATAVLRLPLEQAVLKQRTGPVSDDEPDLELPYWAGLVPVRTAFGEPEAAPGVTVPLPAHLAGYRRP